MERTRTYLLAFLLAVAVGVTVTWAGGDDEEDIALNQVPQVVKDAALKAVPGIKLTGAEKETENGVVVYELKGAKDGGEYEIEINAKGEVLEIETDDDDDYDDDDDDDDEDDD